LLAEQRRIDGFKFINLVPDQDLAANMARSITKNALGDDLNIKMECRSPAESAANRARRLSLLISFTNRASIAIA